MKNEKSWKNLCRFTLDLFRLKFGLVMCLLYLEKPDRTEETATEEDMFAYRRHRWIFNEEKEISHRYLKFDFESLIKVAISSAGGGAQRCTKVLKCVEGLHNKGFLLTMDNGTEVFAKLPNPNAGPARYLIASEAATREFLREVANVPIPRVLARSSDPKGPVGAEYIIEEKAPDSANLSQYTIGPLTQSELWRSGREDMDLDRGPWQQSEDYARAIGENEVAWIKAHASPRTNAYASLKDPELPGHALALLSKYLDATPYLVPNDPAARISVLWHPDLHLDNVFVDPETCKITSIVDWQGASVAPLFYQSCVPRMFRHDGPVREGWVVPSRPEDFDTLSEEEQGLIDQDLESETIHKYYEAKVFQRAPHHWEVLKQLRDIQLRRNPTWLVTGVWENRDIFFLRQSLIAIAALWDRLRPDETTEVPVSFTKEELDLHAKEDENITGVGNMLKLFRDQGVLPVDGMVGPEDYETAKINCQKFKDIFIKTAKDEEERELFSKLWPYQDQES
ncbi:phosphotransferase family protein [Microsporum canis CBS 113480]|uniref:Altered inheritance of mitochondria protein 9, mitochondrial n=1 Tax=Arthroderma otae (strain ATCC MYA-4605 / CBS 113480) TaxID=554155 RepID=C5FER5_ARTOC|nr:phosphotransferase family protein [Microsporum canis CBS 113480]EEQ28389.1 phosphotransferase family protein [Microsporum canis CBS 113480]